MQIHVVSSGETITSISAAYQVPAWKVIYDNEIRLPDRLVPGQALLILGEEENQKKLSLEVRGYAYPFTFLEYLEEAFLVVRNMLSFSVGFSMEGHLYPHNDEKIRNLAKQFGITSTLVLTPSDEYGRFSTELAHQAASVEAVQDNLIKELLLQMRGKGYGGVDVDFEYIPAEDKAGYVNFVTRLRTAMSKEGYHVSVALPPKTSAEQTGLLYEGIDYRALGEAADSVLLMTYEWGYTYGPPMAVAPLNKVNEVIEYALTEIDRNKIFMGIPNYAYDWVLPFEKGVTKAITIGNVDAVQIAAENNAAIEFDETAQSPWFRYVKNGVEHEVWFEDVRSIQSKMLLAASHQLRGVTYWNLLRPFRANWLMLEELLKVEK